jgi:hypothetical protein
MGLTAKDTGGGSSFNPIPEGMHQAICYAVYDLGTQYNEVFGNSSHKVLVVWELPDERIDIEKDNEKLNLPRSISKKYTLSLHEKASLRKDLESWRGKSFTPAELQGFDLTKLLGANCMLQIIHKKKDNKTYANIQSIVPLIKGSIKKEPENTCCYFSFEEHATNIPQNTPDWIIDLIKASDEWDILHSESGIEEIPYNDTPPPGDDDIPF